MYPVSESKLASTILYNKYDVEIVVIAPNNMKEDPLLKPREFGIESNIVIEFEPHVS